MMSILVCQIQFGNSMISFSTRPQQLQNKLIISLNTNQKSTGAFQLYLKNADNGSEYRL